MFTFLQGLFAQPNHMLARSDVLVGFDRTGGQYQATITALVDGRRIFVGPPKSSVDTCLREASIWMNDHLRSSAIAA